MTKGSKKYRRKGKNNNHTHKKVSHKHKGKGNKKHIHDLNNSTIKNISIRGNENNILTGGMHYGENHGENHGDNNSSSVDVEVEGNYNKVIASTGDNNHQPSHGDTNGLYRFKTPPPPPPSQKYPNTIEPIDPTKKTREAPNLQKIYSRKNTGQYLFPPTQEEEEKEEKEEEDHEIDEILEYIDINYILNEENEENIMDYISYCVYQWELYEQLYKDYSIPKDEYYQNMIDELYNDSLYTNNIDKDYDFISDTDYDFISFKNQFKSDETKSGEQSGGVIKEYEKNEGINKRGRGNKEGKEASPDLKRVKSTQEKDNTEMDVAVDNNEIEVTKEEEKGEPMEEEKEEDKTMEEEEEKTPDEKINIIKDIFSKNDSYHDFLKGTRAVYLQPPPKKDIIDKMGSLIAPQEQTSQTSQSSTYPIQTEYFHQSNVLEQYSQILQRNLHSEGSVLKKTLALDGIDTKKTFSSYIKDNELGSFILKINEKINKDKKNSILNNYYVIPKISQNENSDFSLEDNYMYFIRKDENPKNNYNMLQHICKDMGLTYTVCLGVFLNELVRESSTVYPISVLDSLDNFKSYSNQFLAKIDEKLKFKFLEEIKTLAKKMDPIVRSLEQVVDFSLNEKLNEEYLKKIYITAYQLVLKYLFGITEPINDFNWISDNNNIIVGVKFILLVEGNENNIDFYFTTNTVEIVSQAIVAIVAPQSETYSQNDKVKQIINTAQQIHDLQSPSPANKNDIIIILTKLKTQGDLYQIITAYLINLEHPISFYTEDRLCLSIAFMIDNFLKEEVEKSKPLNVFFKASSGQYEDETSEDNIYILMDTKMNKEVTVCSSAMLLTTKNDYKKLCLNEILKVKQDFIKFRDRFAGYGIDELYEDADTELNTHLGEISIMYPADDNEEEKSDSEINEEDKNKFDIIRINVAKLHSLIDFNENISDAFLEYAFPLPPNGIIDKLKKVFKTNVPISKQFTKFGNFSVKAWMEWQQGNSGIHKYLKENINSLEERKKKLEKASTVASNINYNNDNFSTFLNELITKSDELIEEFKKDFTKKINALKQPTQSKRTGNRSGTSSNQTSYADTSELEQLREKKDSINSDIAKLGEEKTTIIDSIKTKLPQKENIFLRILEKIQKNSKLNKTEEKLITKNELEQINNAKKKISEIKSTIKEYSKKLISCVKKIDTEQNKFDEPNFVPEKVKEDLLTYLLKLGASTSTQGVSTQGASTSSSSPAQGASTPLPPPPPSSSSKAQGASSSFTLGASSSKGGKNKKSRKNRKRRTRLNNKKTKRKTKNKSKRSKKKKTIKKHKRTRKKKQYKR